MARRTSRRRALRAIGALTGAGLAGCSGTPTDVDDTPSGRPASATSSTLPDADTPAASTTPPPEDAHLGIRNEAEVRRRVTIVVTDESGATSFDRTFDVNGGVARSAEGVGDVVARPGTYTVTARLESGNQASYEWRLEDALGDLTVVVTPEGGLEFTQRVRCSPACRPVSRDGTAADLPYAAPSADETFTEGNVEIENDREETVLLTLEIRHGGTEILHYTYEVTPDRHVSVDGVTATAGAYDVVVTTASGERHEHTWEIPPEHGWPELSIRLRPDGEALIGCGGPREVGVQVRSEASDPRTLSLRLSRDGSTVEETTETVDPGEETTAWLTIPIGGRYVLAVETDSGDRSASELLVCYCLSDRPEVVVEADGLRMDSTRAACA